MEEAISYFLSFILHLLFLTKPAQLPIEITVVLGHN